MAVRLQYRFGQFGISTSVSTWSSMIPEIANPTSPLIKKGQSAVPRPAGKARREGFGRCGRISFSDLQSGLERDEPAEGAHLLYFRKDYFVQVRLFANRRVPVAVLAPGGDFHQIELASETGQTLADFVFRKFGKGHFQPVADFFH